MADTKYIWGTGRRKTSVARVRIVAGSGKITVNGREADKFFPLKRHIEVINAPMKATKTLKNFDIFANVHGGGVSGQAGAIVLGISRALLKDNEEHMAVLRAGSFLTRDSRMVERKKYGRKKARKSFQFSKR